MGKVKDLSTWGLQCSTRLVFAIKQGLSLAALLGHSTCSW